MSCNHDKAKEMIRTLQDMPNDVLICDIADLFKVFGDTTRMKILFALFKSEMSVNAISDMLDMQQSAISHQLRVLKQARLVSSRRDGKTIYYSLADDHIATILSTGIDHIEE